MSAGFRGVATAFYRLAAKFSARMLIASPAVKSVLLHRSTASGEVVFGQSDIDLTLVLKAGRIAEGANIASLYEAVNRARRFNPALKEIDVYAPDAIASFANIDTFWSSIEHRTAMLLGGEPVEIPGPPVQPDHAVSKFLLWVEWFFAVSVQQRNRRNLRKISLECWNAYAVAAGLVAEPLLTRSAIEAHARRIEGNSAIDGLEEVSSAVRFVFDLADRLHRMRLPALRKLENPLIFETVTAPLSLQRLLVVMPRADSPLPPQAFDNGSFPCTPEILDLFVHIKNAFLDWILPQQLRELGLKPPSVAEFLLSCRYYSHSRFLFHPGFANPSASTQATRLACVRHALEWIARGELPPPIPQEKILEMTAAGTAEVADYYRTDYERLWRETRLIEESLSDGG